MMSNKFISPSLQVCINSFIFFIVIISICVLASDDKDKESDPVKEEVKKDDNANTEKQVEGAQKSSKQKENKPKETRREQMFNKDKRTPDETGYVNRSTVERECEKARPCYSSELIVPVCGSNNKTYLNPGVFICAQKCDDGIQAKNFGPCPGYIMPTTTSTTEKTTVLTTPRHTTVDTRIRIRGVVQRFFSWLGLHVHDDGGFYLDDEKENDAWWNI